MKIISAFGWGRENGSERLYILAASGGRWSFPELPALALIICALLMKTGVVVL